MRTFALVVFIFILPTHTEYNWDRMCTSGVRELKNGRKRVFIATTTIENRRRETVTMSLRMEKNAYTHINMCVYKYANECRISNITRNEFLECKYIPIVYAFE